MKKRHAPVNMAALLVGFLSLVACPPSETLPAPSSPLALDLARSQGYVKDSWVGVGDSQKMHMDLKNLTGYEYSVQVEVGTKLKPKDGDVQNMVVTHELEVHVHPHEKVPADLDVACLDISKDPPGQSNKTWDPVKLPELARFIGCTNGFLDDLKHEHSDQADSLEKIRTGFVQTALWNARDASRAQWIEFYVKYQGLTEEDAAQRADQMSPLLDETKSRCGSLATQ